MYSLSRRGFNGVVSPFPNHRLTLKPFSDAISFRNPNTPPLPKLKISSSLNPNFSLFSKNVKNSSCLIPIVKQNVSSMIFDLSKKTSSLPLVVKISIVYLFVILNFKRIHKKIREIVLVGCMRLKFRVGDVITTTVNGEEVKGSVEIKGLFGTTVKLDDGKRFYISNEDLFNSGSVIVQIRPPFTWLYSEDSMFEIFESLRIREEDMKLKMGNIFQKAYYTVKIQLEGVLSKLLELAGAHKTLTTESCSIDMTGSSIDEDTTDTSIEDSSSDPVHGAINITTTVSDTFSWTP